MAAYIKRAFYLKYFNVNQDPMSEMEATRLSTGNFRTSSYDLFRSRLFEETYNWH